MTQSDDEQHQKESIAERTCEACGHCFDRKRQRDYHVANDVCADGSRRGFNSIYSQIDVRTQRLYTTRVQTGPDAFQCRYCSKSFGIRTVELHEDAIHFQGVVDPGRYSRPRPSPNNDAERHGNTVHLQGITDSTRPKKRARAGSESSSSHDMDYSEDDLDYTEDDALPEEATDSSRYRTRAKSGTNGMEGKVIDVKNDKSRESAKANAKNEDASRENTPAKARGKGMKDKTRDVENEMPNNSGKADAEKKDASKENTPSSAAKGRYRSMGITPASRSKTSAKNQGKSSSIHGIKHHKNTVDLQGVMAPIRYAYLAGSGRRVYICD